MNNVHPASEIIYCTLCIVIMTIIGETGLINNPYFEYGTLIGIPLITLALGIYRYKSVMKEKKNK